MSRTSNPPSKVVDLDDGSSVEFFTDPLTDKEYYHVFLAGGPEGGNKFLVNTHNLVSALDNDPHPGAGFDVIKTSVLAMVKEAKAKRGKEMEKPMIAGSIGSEKRPKWPFGKTG